MLHRKVWEQNTIPENIHRGSIDYSRVKVTYKSVRNETYKSGLLTYHKMFSLKAVDLQLDNTSALSNLKRMGGICSGDMTVLAIDISPTSQLLQSICQGSTM